MNIEAKANELYPVMTIDSRNIHYMEQIIDMNADKREAYLKGREDERAELSGTPDEAEEVFKIYCVTEKCNGIITKKDALKAMQKYAASRVAKVTEELATCNVNCSNYYATMQQQAKRIKELEYRDSCMMKEVDSRDKQLSEKDKEIERKTEAFDELVEFAKEAASENQRLTAEVERLKKSNGTFGEKS